MTFERICKTPVETFALGNELGRLLQEGDIFLLHGGLGAGKTLLTKGILHALDFDADEVTSPSFTLVNLYKTAKIDVYHIDLWRLDAAANPFEAVGLGEILEYEKSAAIIEWADRLGELSHTGSVISIEIKGDGDQPRNITVRKIKNHPDAESKPRASG